MRPKTDRSRDVHSTFKATLDHGAQDMTAMVRTPVLPEANLVGALSAQLRRIDGDPQCPLDVCAVPRRRFPVGASPTRQPLQPEATGAVMELTKWLKPSV